MQAFYEVKIILLFYFKPMKPYYLNEDFKEPYDHILYANRSFCDRNLSGDETAKIRKKPVGRTDGKNPEITALQKRKVR